MKFVRNAWYLAAWASEVTDRPIARRICNQPIVLYRDRATGSIAALQDRCCHRGAPLSLGAVTDCGLRCGYHGLVFDATGACVHVPGQDRISTTARVQSFPAQEKQGMIWIWLGEHALADIVKILDYPFHGDPKWPHRTQTYRVKANYLLLVENLMDLTHLPYVHSSTIGGDPKAHVEAEMAIQRGEGSIRFTRWLTDCPPPPTHMKANQYTGHVDRWMDFEYVAPSVVLQWTGSLPTGKDAKLNRDQEGAFSLRILHVLTPETDSTCFYFWSVANGFNQHDPHATELVFSEIDEAFAEDKRMVEQQQAVLTEFGESDLVSVISDGARIQMRRVLEKMVDKEVI